MRQSYRPYWTWEDWLNGMWNKLPINQEEKMLIKALDFTSDHVKYGLAMSEVIEKWTNTMLNSLSNRSINRRAFLGHCAVSYKIQCPEYITRRAWKLLTNEQRELADLEAEKRIKEWEKTYINALMTMSENGKKDVTRTVFQMSLQLK